MKRITSALVERIKTALLFIFNDIFHHVFFQVDLLNDIAHPPRILTSFSQAIQPATFKRDLDSYLKTRAPVTFLSELRSHLQVRKFLILGFLLEYKQAFNSISP